MSTYKHIDRICAVIILLCLVLTVVFMNGQALGLQAVSRQYGYEERLFDTSKVHTLAIVMDDWDSFLDTCESEEYSLCSVVIDGDSYKNVAIRAKGNTSLSNVSSMNSDRYSFKIEFDHYDSGKTYFGLDKLSLNNIIQDNTFMKDYLAYRMMRAFQVDAPLCSYVYITVNGEDWGLYLAVEGVEDAFLQRNYGSSDGELYKPDSLSFGGGRGNGKDFDMTDFMDSFDGTETDDESTVAAAEESTDSRGGRGGFGNFGGFGGEMPEGMELPDNFELPEGMELSGDFEMPEGLDLSESFEKLGDKMGNMAGGGFGGMGSSDVKLSYIDDDPSSYSNIFNNAKTDITTADKKRLIASLKTLSSYENIESVVDTEEVLRYFVVHNFVVNGDSYTGSMIHNYYLYEEDGVLSMIPWDYNLAYGTFSGGAGSSSVNDPIDDVLDDRPMQAWIFSDESYTERYHQLYREFLETVDMQGMIAEADALISAYVEQDPTKFCTMEEYRTGVETLKSFCSLRSESVAGQLDGSIPSTSEGQQENSAALVDTNGLNLSDMGSMGNSMGGGFGGFSRDSGVTDENTDTADMSGGSGGGRMPSGNFGGFGDGEMPSGDFGGFGDGEMPSGDFGRQKENMTRPDSDVTDTAQADSETQSGESSGSQSQQKPDRSQTADFPAGDGYRTGGNGQTTAVLLGASVLLLLLGLLFAWKYRK